MIKNYEEAINYLTSFIPESPDYKFPGDLGLQRMGYFLSLLGNPQDEYKTIHIAGTSGKGSTSYLIAKILKEADFKTGLHVSPHLESERERMQINEKMISKTEFTYLINKIVPVVLEVSKTEFGNVTYYEILLALTFLYFANEKVDIAVIETGLGGTYDGTNILKSTIAVITPISLDHMNILGDTLSEISQNKAGIIKNGQIAVISASQKKEAEEILIEKIKKEQVSFFEEGSDYTIDIKKIDEKGVTFSYKDKEIKFENIYCSLLGIHQAQNAGLAIRVVKELTKLNIFVSEQVVRKALSTSFFPGRIDVRKFKGKTIVLDGAHNEDKMKILMESMKRIWPKKRILAIVAFKDDKDISSISKIFANKIDRLIVTKFSSYTDMGKYKSMDQERVVDEIKKAGFDNSVIITSHVEEAIETALKQAKSEDIILVTGSLYLVGEVLILFKNIPSRKSIL